MKPSPPTREDKLRFVVLFVIIYAGILSVIRSDPIPRQVLFRAGLVLAGVLGLIVLHLRKSRR